MTYGNLKSEIDNSPVLSMFQNIHNNISGDDFMQTSKSLTNDDIIHLPTSLFTLVEATETVNYSSVPNTLPIPMEIIIRVDSIAGAYTNVDANARWSVWWGGMDFEIMAMHTTNLDSASSARIYRLRPSNIFTSSSAPDNPHFHEIVSYIDGFNLDGGLLDNSIRLSISNGSLNDLEDGNVANSMSVTVVYAVVTL